MIKNKFTLYDFHPWLKRTFFVLMILVLFLSGCNHQKNQDQQQSIKILTFGDSITRGVREGVRNTQTFTYYLDLLFKKNRFHVEMINKGVSGETTIGALNRIERDVLRVKPHYVTIMYGTNDAFIDNYANETGHLPRIPIERYKKNLHSIVQILKANNIKPILMTPIPMGRFGGLDVGIYKINGINFMLKKYAEVVRQVSTLENVPLVDHFNQWLKWQKRGKDIDTWMTDGVHPNPKGHRVIATTIFKIFRNCEL